VLGCQYGQGYLYGKAMPPEELVALVEQQEKKNLPSKGLMTL
jgi:sensor c-di-GMP phosphodiesterase-like protein